MTQLDEKEHNAQMDDMKSFDEQMPCVGIFWYDPEDHTLFGVRKKELTQGADKPYTVDGQIYLQIGDSIQKADSEQTIRILNQNVCNGNGWERTPIHDASKEDISEEVIERFRNQLRKDNRIPKEASTIGIMRKLGFISAGTITNAGIVVTAKEPTAFFPQTSVC